MVKLIGVARGIFFSILFLSQSMSAASEWGGVNLYDCLCKFMKIQNWETEDYISFFEPQSEGDGTIRYFKDRGDSYDDVDGLSFLEEFDSYRNHGVNVRIFSINLGVRGSFLAQIGRPDEFIAVFDEPADFPNYFLTFCVSENID